jgi:hypothetical protein
VDSNELAGLMAQLSEKTEYLRVLGSY